MLNISEKTWRNIKNRVIVPLWNGKFKNLYESVKLDYDDFESLAGYELSRAIKNFNPEKSNLLTFSTKIICNKAMTELRDCTQREKRKALYLSENIDSLDKATTDDMFKNTEDDSLSDKMIRYLGRLSKLQKEILYAISEGYSSEEIIARLNITPKEMTEACTAIKSYRNVSILF